MTKINYKYIVTGFFMLAAFSICFVMGFLKWAFFIPAALSLAGYIVIDRKYLRCPGCGGFANIDRLFYAVKHNYHCSRCGERINIEK